MRFPNIIVLIAIVLSACYAPSLPNGVQQCGSNGACPSGYQCGGDGKCYKNGQAPKVLPDMSVGDLALPCTAETCKGTPSPICDPQTKGCVACLVDGDCPSGKVCKQKACVPGCSLGHGCPDGGGMCDPGGGMCKRCGGDNDCGGNTPRCELVSGTCAACLPLNDNCLKGFFCNLVNGVYSCAQGCQKDFDCTPAPDGGVQKLVCCNHACADTLSDGANCGACGASCGAKSCCSGSCLDTVNDPANCGGCGLTCSGKNASWTCKTSRCTVASCAPGYADCNINPVDGCEANLANDVGNCGACGTVCSAANGTPSCGAGSCTWACNAGFAHCAVGNTGCETSTNDVANCGACGTVCSSLNGTPSCGAGTCTFSCNAGFAHCAVGNTGCEANTTNDRNNCSKCGMVCPNGGNCTNSVCGLTMTIDTHNFNGMTEYPLDTDKCMCCGVTTTKQTADAFCKLAGFTSSVSWVSAMVSGTNCYCWNCTMVNAWVSNCCGGLAVRPEITSVTCQ